VGDDPAAVAANRARLARELGLAAERVVFMEQIHSKTVTVVTGPQESAVPMSDAIVTNVPDLALVALAADCVPILLSDANAGVVAAVHAGRMGARNGVVAQALVAMSSLGAQLNRVEALLGPAVCGKCYEVPKAMQADVEARLPGSASTTRQGTAGLDLHAGIHAHLAAVGIGKIGADPRCTYEDKSLFSHRRHSLNSDTGTTGRHGAIIWMDTNGD
jgi:YfiH family protein